MRACATTRPARSSCTESARSTTKNCGSCGQKTLAVLKHNAIPHELPAAWERRSDQFHCDDDVPYTGVHKFAITHPIDGLTDEEARLVAELGPQVLAATDDWEYESDDDDTP